MPCPQFSLSSFLGLLTVCTALAAWWSTGFSVPAPEPPLDSGSWGYRISGGMLLDALSSPAAVSSRIAALHNQRQRCISATIATSLFFVALTWCILLTRDRLPARRLARNTWTLAWLCFLAHVAAAFHFQFGWSHARAAWNMGWRTYEFSGWFWTGGIWINYFFTLLWTADVLYWWSGLDRYHRRPVQLRWFVHAFFAFMIFQGGVVFASGAIRWSTLAGLGVVGTFGLVRLIHSR